MSRPQLFQDGFSKEQIESIFIDSQGSQETMVDMAVYRLKFYLRSLFGGDTHCIFLEEVVSLFPNVRFCFDVTELRTERKIALGIVQLDGNVARMFSILFVYSQSMMSPCWEIKVIIGDTQLQCQTNDMQTALFFLKRVSG